LGGLAKGAWGPGPGGKGGPKIKGEKGRRN